MKCKYIIGIDEVGRGPLAGPVAVGVFCVQASRPSVAEKILARTFSGARDSKKLSPQKREEIFEKIKKVIESNPVTISYTVQFESAHTIDTKGLTWAIKNCIKKGLRKLELQQNIHPAHVHVLLDGGLKAPVEYMHQKTIIRGDDSEIVISLASIVAKVTRDRYMRKLAKKYPAYGFDVHKGYGTLKHRKAIRTYGLCPEHRKSFCTVFL